jgi:quercetin dioxygenase-like cupin family protein
VVSPPDELPARPDPDGPAGDDDVDADVASALAWALPPARPGSPVLDRLLERARATAVSTLQRTDGMWFRVADGVSGKLVFSDAQDRGTTTLWRMDAGARVTLRADSGDVVLVVIEGTVQAEDDAVGAPLVVGDAVGLHASAVRLRAEGPAAVLVAVSFAPLEGAPEIQVVRLADVPGVPVNPSVTARPLFLHVAPRPDVAVLTVEPNGVLEAHDHPETEELLCLDGTCDSHGERLEPGSYQRARAGSAHDVTTTTTGSTILVLRRHFT